MTCWRCREPVQGPTCVGCGAVQPLPPDLDLFAVVGLPRRYHVADAEIEAAVRARSRLVHPDRHVRSSSVERQMALQWTARVNEARRVLRDPLRRAAWLALGRTDVEKAPPPTDPDFLEKVFSWRMGVETGDPEVTREVREVRDALLRALDDTFTTWEEGRGDLHAAEDLLTRLRFVNNVAAEAGL